VIVYLAAPIDFDKGSKVTKIKDEIKEGGKTVEGALFKATYVEANRKVTDWKAIAKAYNIPDEAVIDNTTVSAVYSVKVTAR